MLENRIKTKTKTKTKIIFETKITLGHFWTWF